MTRPQPPHHLLTVDEYIGLPEEGGARTELQEGALVTSPSPIPRHMVAMGRLFGLVERQLPAVLRAVPDVDVDLELAPSDKPGFVRRPDLVVVDAAAFERVEGEGGVLRAADVVLAVEIISPGSKRLDTVVKRGEYADAGIPHYWIIDLNRPITLAACHLAEEFGYLDGGDVGGEFSTTVPFPVRVRLDDLC